MLKYLGIVLLVLIVVQQSCSAVSLSDSDYWDGFLNYMTIYGKSYDSSEMQERFQVYIKNCQSMDEANDLNSGVRYANVQFTADSGSSVSSSSPSTKQLLSVNDQTMTLSFSNSAPLQSVNEYSDMSYYEFVSTYTGGAVEPISSGGAAAAASTGLSAGAIAGIVVGGAAVLTAGVVSAVFIVKHKQKTLVQQNSQPQQSSTEQEPNAIPMKPFGGVNVFDLKPGSRQSITARGVPISLEDVSLDDK